MTRAALFVCTLRLTQRERRQERASFNGRKRLGAYAKRLPVALGITRGPEECRRQDLLDQIRIAQRDGIPGHKQRHLNTVPLLIIDELGYVEFDKSAATWLFQLIWQRYGWAARKRNPKDTRIVHVYLTDDGRDVAATQGNAPMMRADMSSPQDQMGPGMMGMQMMMRGAGPMGSMRGQTRPMMPGQGALPTPTTTP
jgi:IstB-like ATP binding protein